MFMQPEEVSTMSLADTWSRTLKAKGFSGILNGPRPWGLGDLGVMITLPSEKERELLDLLETSGLFDGKEMDLMGERRGKSSTLTFYPKKSRRASFIAMNGMLAVESFLNLARRLPESREGSRVFDLAISMMGSATRLSQGGARFSGEADKILAASKEARKEIGKFDQKTNADMEKLLNKIEDNTSSAKRASLFSNPSLLENRPMRNLTASDRASLIRLAASLPKGDGTRRAILSSLQGVRIAAIEVETRYWQASTGRNRPSGYGGWKFTFDRNSRDYQNKNIWFDFVGNYGDAKKAAIAWAKSVNPKAFTIYLGE